MFFPEVRVRPFYRGNWQEDLNGIAMLLTLWPHAHRKRHLVLPSLFRSSLGLWQGWWVVLVSVLVKLIMTSWFYQSWTRCSACKVRTSCIHTVLHLSMSVVVQCVVISAEKSNWEKKTLQQSAELDMSLCVWMHANRPPPDLLGFRARRILHRLLARPEWWDTLWKKNSCNQTQCFK